MSMGNQGDSALAMDEQNSCHVIPEIEVHDLESQKIDGYKPPLALEHARYGKLTVLCAEPGMGKSHIASILARMASLEGRTVYRYSFDDADSASVSRRLVRRCTELRSKRDASAAPLAIIDGVTPGDEFETQREAAALERLVDEGMQVFVCIRPEAEQLAERLCGADRPSNEHLLFRPYDDSAAGYSLTGGIPALVAAQLQDRSRGEEASVAGPCYLMTLEQIVGQSLRHGLTDEELRIRMAMVLLGEGSIDDVAMVSGRCDTEQFFLLARDSAFFGIDLRESTFKSFGMHVDDVLEQCLGSLQGMAASIPAVVVRACGLLATQGRLRRSALVSRLCSSRHDFASVGTSWGVLYAAVGEGGLVKEALQAARSLGFAENARTIMSRVAVASMMEQGGELDAATRQLETLNLSSPADRRMFHTLEQMLAIRGLFRNPQEASRCLTVDPGDSMGVAVLNRMRISRLVRAGSFSEVYSVISNEMPLRVVTSVPEALVCDCLFLSLALCGGCPDKKERAVLASAERLLARSGMRHMRLYHEALMSAIPILMGSGTDTTQLEDGVSHAERMGDSFIQALFFFAMAVADIRTRALTRAHVRAARAEEIFRALGESYLTSAASFVNAVACELLGDAGALVAFGDEPGQPEGLLLVSRLLASASNSAGAGHASVDIPLGAPCPRDELWALNVLADSNYSLWKNVSTTLPATWLERIRAARLANGPQEGKAPAPKRRGKKPKVQASHEDGLGAGTQTQLGLAMRTAMRVRISVLGEFAVECDGVKAADSAFERRHARELMMLLATVSGHRMRRYQMIEVLYPEEDYERGPRRLYEATGEARRSLKELCSGLNPLKVDRSQGTISLDAAVVQCDVDEFESEARKTLVESGDDFLVLEHGRRLARLYRNGPDERLLLMGDLVKDRVGEIRRLFVDASVAVGEAALRLGKAKLAIRYGTDAHKVDGLREDVVLLLVRALRAAGRGFEVKELYREFARRLGDELGALPSLELRRAVERATSQTQ